jgi:tRNA A37 methylthiotransferase MiaB
MRPLVLVVAPNPFGDGGAPSYESDFWLRTRSGHLASFSNLVRLFNPVASAQQLGNRGKASRSLAGYYLESFLKTHGYDARAVFTLDEAGAWASASGARPVAIAVSTTFITTVTELARTLRRVREGAGPDVPIVVGGQFVWKQYLWGPDRFAGRPEVEERPDLAHLFSPAGDPILREPLYVVSEFGEHTLLRLLEAIRGGARTLDAASDVENLAAWTPGAWRFTRRAAEPVDLDRDFTRWDVVDDMPVSMVPVRTSVGCPHACEFCDFVAVHPLLRLRSARSIVEELRLVAARGATSISFVDDNALSSRGRARELARELTASGLGLRWGGYLRADRVGEEEALLLAASGLMYAWCGIESGDPDVLRRMKKRSDLEAARTGIDALTREGVHVLATFVLGFPGETRASVDASVSFLNGLRRDVRGAVEYLVFPFQVSPGSPVDRPDRRREFGLTGLLGSWRHATMSSEEVRGTWAPHFFRGVEAGYTYYGGDNSSLWSAARRAQAVASRKALTIAFLDGATDEVVQERFAALHRTLQFTRGATPSWRECLAPREQQPGAAAALADAGWRTSAAGGA